MVNGHGRFLQYESPYYAVNSDAKLLIRRLYGKHVIRMEYWWRILYCIYRMLYFSPPARDITTTMAISHQYLVEC
jgi:hypothetical protein